MTYPFTFHATYYDEFNHEQKVQHGVLFASSYAEAAEKIDVYYGTELVDMKLMCLEESDILHLPADVVQHIEEDDFYGFDCD